MLELKIGIFVSFALLLAMAAVWLLGGGQHYFARKQNYFLAVPDVGGLVAGAHVTIAGVRAGTVKSIELNPSIRSAKITVDVAGEYIDAIRADSKAALVTHGLLGDRIVEISPGTPSLPSLPPGSEIPARMVSPLEALAGIGGENLATNLSESAHRLSELLGGLSSSGKMDKLMASLILAAKNVSSVARTFDKEIQDMPLKKAVNNLNSILAKVDHGTGNASRFINDQELYDDLKALIGEVNRNRIFRNLVRKSVNDSRRQEETQQSKDSAENVAGKSG